MSSPAIAKAYTTVALLGGYYVAYHVQPDKKIPISEHPEEKFSVAQAAARAFAETQKIPFQEDLKEFKVPIMTVWKKASGWHPLAIYSDKTVFLTEMGTTQEAAIQLAQKIADAIQTDFVPSMGISASSRA